jgi:hypothetical protein
MEAAFQAAVADNSGEDIDWSVFFNRALLNVSFFVADYVFVHGIANALKETDVNVAHEKLLRDLGPTSNDPFGIHVRLCQIYIPKIH